MRHLSELVDNEHLCAYLVLGVARKLFEKAQLDVYGAPFHEALPVGAHHRCSGFAVEELRVVRWSPVGLGVLSETDVLRGLVHQLRKRMRGLPNRPFIMRQHLKPRNKLLERLYRGPWSDLFGMAWGALLLIEQSRRLCIDSIPV